MTPEFYHNIITAKSFELLQSVKKQYNFVLIGGWAVFLYSHALKSKDIDIIIDYPELAKLKEHYQVAKNDRLKKYEIQQGETDIDIYLPHYSALGIDIEKITQNAILREGFLVPELEILFMMKLFAWENRRGSVKGQKDELDIFSLAMLSEFDWLKYSRYVSTYKFGEQHNEFIALLKTARDIDELNINEQQMAKFRKKILKDLK